MNKIRYNRVSIVLDEFQVSQKDVAAYLGVTNDTVSRWCRNRNQPSLAMLYRIAEGLRVNITKLVEPTEWKDASGPTPVEKFLEE